MKTITKTCCGGKRFWSGNVHPVLLRISGVHAPGSLVTDKDKVWEVHFGGSQRDVMKVDDLYLNFCENKDDVELYLKLLQHILGPRNAPAVLEHSWSRKCWR